MSAASAVFIAEPPASYQVKTPLVVDASLMAAIVFGEVQRDLAEASLRGRALHAPSLIDYEIASVASTKLRRGELTPELAALVLAEFTRLALERHPPSPAPIVALAQRYGLSAYDAAYLWLADALKAPLATFDQRLAAAATEHLGNLPTP